MRETGSLQKSLGPLTEKARLRIWGSGVRISSGAAIAYKTVNICSLCLAPCDKGCESGPVSEDCHFVVVDFDLRDYGPEVGSPRLYVAGFQFIPHEAAEGFEVGGGNRRACIQLDRNPIEGGLRDVPFGLECLDPLLQMDIQVDKPVLKCAIEPLQFFLLGGQFRFQRSAPILHGSILVALTFNERFEDAGEAFSCKQALLDVVDDEIVEFAHWNMAAWTYGLALLLAAAEL